MKNWRDISMPKGISKLPRSESGMPVPFVALWSSEERSFMRYDAEIQHHGLFSRGELGQGKPLFGQMETFRQRQCMLKPLCSVCGCRLDPKKAWITDNGKRAPFRGELRPLILEPWNCGPCLAYSIQVCPGIKRDNAKDHFSVLKVIRHEFLKTLVKPEGNLIDKPLPQGGVVSYVKVIPLEFSSQTASQWLRQYKETHV